MMKWVFVGIIFLSVVFGVLTGKIGEVSIAAIKSSSKAVELCVSLMGTICFWLGIMKVAEASGLTKKISKLMYPFTRLLFKGLEKDSQALSTISMNITANLLGIGNAATPLGIRAMKQLKEEEDVKDQQASKNMIMLVVINTASMQLLPTTIAMIRVNHGSTNPLDILPLILICSAISLLSGVFMANILGRISDKRAKGGI